ncbi:MAG: matrixin family metalloprotease [Bacteroidota bacterium]
MKTISKLTFLIAFILANTSCNKIQKKSESTLNKLFKISKNHVSKNIDNSEKELENKLDNRFINLTIRALGDVDDDDLEYASQVVKDFYGYNINFESPTAITPSILTDNGDLDMLKSCINLQNTSKTLYVTDTKIYDGEELLRGVTSGDNKTIIVRGEKRFMKETIIHEIGHSLGLDHCPDKTCVMAIDNDLEDSGDFCDICKKKVKAN